jgi:hypothetical protein
MTTAEHPTLDDPRAPSIAREVQVRARFQAMEADSGDAVPRAQLEDLAVKVVEAVEVHAATVALGPVVACDFSTGEVELEFTVEALRPSEVHQRISVVLSVIERYTPMAIERVSETEPVEPVPA